MDKKKKSFNFEFRFPICIFLATILWLYVMTEKNPETVYSYLDVPVQILNENTLNSRELQAMNLENFTATVSVRGLKSDILSFNENNIVATLDLSGYGAGNMKVPLQVKLKQNNSDLSIQKVDPSYVSIQFDKIVSSHKPIKISYIGEVEEGKILGQIETDVEEVSVKGPESLVNKVKYAEGVINLDGKDDDSHFSVDLKLIDEEGNPVEGVTVSPNEVSGKLPVGTGVTLPVKLEFTGEVPENMVIESIEFKPEEVGVIGSRKDLNLHEISTKPINLSDFAENSVKEIELDMPKNLKLQKPDTKILLEIKYTKEMEKTISVSPYDIKILNPHGIEYSFLDKDNIEVILKGNEHILKEFNPQFFVEFSKEKYESEEVSLNIQIADPPLELKTEIKPPSLRFKINKNNVGDDIDEETENENANNEAEKEQ